MKLVGRREAVAAAIGGIIGVGAILALSPDRDNTDVRSFGARGDGRHDDTTAVQRAIDRGGNTLWFPPGRYRITAPLRPRSEQRWHGAGAMLSWLEYGGTGTSAPFNLLQNRPNESLTGLTLDGLGFLGARSRQLVNSRTGQEGFALYLRTELRDLTIRDCRFEHFGDGRDGGGGVLLGPRPEQTIPGPVNLLVERCVFTDNGNVPGIYVCGGSPSQGEASGIRIVGNTFGGAVGSTKFQNTIYVLGRDGTTPFRQVDISHNRFDFAHAVDVAIELNWVEGYTITANTVHFQAAIRDSAAILLRDGCTDGVVSSNVITSISAEPSLHGIVAMNFSHPGRIENLLISGNLISGVAGAIAADRGSRGVVIEGNRVNGRADGGGFGIRVLDAAAIHVAGNMITAMGHAVELGHGDRPESGLRDVVVERNRFLDCGGNGLALIAGVYPDSGLTVQGLAVRENLVSSPRQGSQDIDPALTSMLPPS